MTDDRLAFDGLLMDVLERTGPHRAPTTIVPSVLERTERHRQVRALAPLLDRRMWPPRGGTLADPATWRTLRTATAIALVAASIATAAVVGAHLMTPRPILPYRGELTHVATLSTKYWHPELVALDDATILIVGGPEAPGTAAEVVDITTGMGEPIEWSEAHVTIDQAVRTTDGRVVGLGVRWSDVDTERIGVLVGIDPAGRTASVIATLPDQRAGATLAALADGRVLIIGGERSGGSPTAVATVEVFDPTAGTITPGGALQVPRAGASAIVLTDGRVLIVGGSQYEPVVTGGWDVDSGVSHAVREVEVYSPTTGVSTAIGTLPDAVGGVDPVLLADGRVLIAGGQDEQRCGRHGIDSVSSYVVDPSTDVLASGPRLPHDVSSLTLLDDGAVLMVGWWSALGPAPGGCEFGADQTYVTDAWMGTLDVATGATRLSLDPFTGLASLPGDPDIPLIGGVRLADGRVILATWDTTGTEWPAAPTVLMLFD